MAAVGNLGVPHARILNSELSRGKFAVPTLSFSRLTWTRATARQYTGLALPWRFRSTLVALRGQVLSSESANESEEASVEESSSHPTSQLIPGAHDVEFLVSELCDTTKIAEFELKVEFLVSELCDTTKIAEFELKLNGFHLHIKRHLDQNLQPPSPSPATVDTKTEQPVENGSVMSTSLAIYKPGASVANFEKKLLASAADEGLELIRSPRVGFFRRGRMLKKKRRAPPPCKEGQMVKEGQVLCYIDQLGGHFPVESNVAGEVVKFLLQEGDSVGYGDPVAAILPSFPGIKDLL